MLANWQHLHPDCFKESIVGVLREVWPVLDPVHVLCACHFRPAETYSTMIDMIDMGSNEDIRPRLARQILGILGSDDVAFKLNVGHPEIRRDDLWRLHMWWMPFGSPLGLWKGGQRKGRPH